MRKEFSSSWTGSSQPRKQRKYRYNAPLHLRHRFLSAHLSKELKAKHSTRAIVVRVGDEVKIMRGKFAGTKGKVQSVNYRRERVLIEGVTRAKRDGTKIAVPFRANVLLITSLYGDDKRRFTVQNKEETKHAPKQSTNK